MSVREWIQIRNFRRGRAGAFDAIYAEYGQRVYRFCVRLTGCADDAEDLAQDVFVAALTGLDRFEARCSISTWLYRIALLRWRAKERRQRAPAGEVSLDTPGEHTMLHTPDHAASRIDRIGLDHALAALPEAHRDAFILVKAEGLTCREAGDVLQIPEGTVRYHVHLAIATLRRLVDLAEIAARTELPASQAASTRSSAPRGNSPAFPVDRIP